VNPDTDPHPAWSFWWPALVAFSIVPIALLATGAVGWLDVVGAVLFVAFMILVMVTVVVPLWGGGFATSPAAGRNRPTADAGV
jgi:hypothetical protein